MKKKINLLNLSKNELNAMKAGAEVACGCLYSIDDYDLLDEYVGYPSLEDNQEANGAGGGSATSCYFFHIVQ